MRSHWKAFDGLRKLLVFPFTLFRRQTMRWIKTFLLTAAFVGVFSLEAQACRRTSYCQPCWSPCCWHCCPPDTTPLIPPPVHPGPFTNGTKLFLKNNTY